MSVIFQDYQYDGESVEGEYVDAIDRNMWPGRPHLPRRRGFGADVGRCERMWNVLYWLRLGRLDRSVCQAAVDHLSEEQHARVERQSG